jgi:hypothetical protein
LVSDEYRRASHCSAHINFSKEKKEKKKAIRPSGGFQKSRFFLKKYYLTRWRFFQKLVGLELAFLKTQNLFLLSFFIFCFELIHSFVYSLNSCCQKDWGLIGRWSSLERV